LLEARKRRVSVLGLGASRQGAGWTPYEVASPPSPSLFATWASLQGRFFGLFDPLGILRRPRATRTAGRLTTAVARADVCAPMPASSRCASFAQRATDPPFFKCTRRQKKKEAAISEAQARRCTMPQSRPRDAPRAALRPLLRKRRILQVLQSPRERDGAKNGAKKGPEKKRFRGCIKKTGFLFILGGDPWPTRHGVWAAFF
jgi:hypothetical protein